MSIWSTLSTIDCKEHIDKKGQFSYLAWTWAWAMVKENYPQATYELLEDTIYPDGTVEVRCSVTINELSHTMWLPVLNFKNAAIQNPNAFDINSARMRCLVKCLAMFGLGHYIYAGESTPQEAPATYTDDEFATFNMLIANEDALGYLEFMSGLSSEVGGLLHNSAPKGEKVKLKDECRKLSDEGHKMLDEYAVQIREARESEDIHGGKGLMLELEDSPKVKGMLAKRLTPEDIDWLNLIKEK